MRTGKVMSQGEKESDSRQRFEWDLPNKSENNLGAIFQFFQWDRFAGRAADIAEVYREMYLGGGTI
jgi:hypothetical protein